MGRLLHHTPPTPPPLRHHASSGVRYVHKVLQMMCAFLTFMCSTIICGPMSYTNCPFLRYLSTLYSHPEWPNIHPRKVRDELRENVKDNWMWLLLTPSWMYKHVNIILQKKSKGQPVSFTDFFGYLVGDTILKDVSLCSLFQALR